MTTSPEINPLTLQPLTDRELGKIVKLTNKQIVLEAEIASLEVMLDRKKEELRDIQMNQLPVAMTEIGLSNFSLSNGASLIVKPFYSCSCTDKEPELKERGLKWLRKEYPSVVKHEVKVTLGVDAVTDLKSIRGFLNKKSIPFKDGQGVHNGTLKALMRECVEAGKPFPLDLFRGFIGKITEITMPK